MVGRSTASRTGMFAGASAFDQDLGWCVDDDVDLGDFERGDWDGDPRGTSASCGVNGQVCFARLRAYSGCNACTGQRHGQLAVKIMDHSRPWLDQDATAAEASRTATSRRGNWHRA